ncbi:MAG: 16S rRNA (guanine(527)-N(7))-methyltransferase RsmG [Alphaproteobacteria bacterium]
MSFTRVPTGSGPPYGPEDFKREFGLSDGVLGRLESYAALLVKWQLRINLVGGNTISELWHRHMRDSAQLIDHMRNINAPWVDIGSGAGFPALVMAIVIGESLALPVHLVESDKRKAIFLREVIRVTGAAAQVHDIRVEDVLSPHIGGMAGLITARAIAPVHQILELAEAITDKETLYLLLKGQDVDDELTFAAKYRKMTVSQHPSRTNSAGKVLRITEVARV